MKFRHEWKFEINEMDRLILRQRMKTVMKPDPHARDGFYHIRSLYFDDPKNTALREKIDGVNEREKFRLRYYNDDLSMIKLEKKSKRNGLCRKQTTKVTRQQVRSLLEGDLAWMTETKDPLVLELYTKMKADGLAPKTIVDYRREPYIYHVANVRVTIDDRIRTGLSSVDFLNPDHLTVPAGDAHIILEVKWDEFLPDIIKDVVELHGRKVGAFSKYAACRIYG